MKLGVKRLCEKAVMPIFATSGSACFDVVCVSRVPHSKKSMIYGTGLAFDIPSGYDLEVYSRSGHGFNDDIRLANGVAQIDQDFTGELKIKLTYDGEGNPNWPYLGDRIVQCKLVKKLKTELIEVEEITKETARGENGFGSTGR